MPIDPLPLPLIGQITEDDHVIVSNHLAALVREAIDDRDQWATIADDSIQLYTYGTITWPTDKIVLNDIQNAIIAATDIQTREPPRAVLEPVETGDNGPQVPMGQPVVDPMSGIAVQPTLEINDRLVAEVFQSLFDRFWSRASLDQWVRDDLLRTNTEGWAFTLFEWDDDEQRIVLQDLSIRQVYADPTKQRIQDFAYAGVDLVLDVDEAKKRYPHIADIIEDRARPGNPQLPTNASDLGQANDRNFERRTVTMRVFWLRNQPCPMGAEQAVAAGLVVPREVPVDDAGSRSVQDPAEMRDVARSPNDADPSQVVGAGVEGVVSPEGLPPGAEPGDVAAGADQAGEAEGAAAPEGQVEEQSDETQLQSPENAPNKAGANAATGEGAGEGAPDDVRGNAAAPLSPGIPTRPGFFHAATGAEVTPDHPDWPTYLCIRQLTVICDVVVDDRESEHYDGIPLLHNVCIPIPGKPWGIGEPFRLQKIQEANSRTVDSMVQHLEYNKHGRRVMPQSVYEATKAAMGTIDVKPNQSIIVPDDMFERTQGKLDFYNDPPPLPPAAVALHEILARKTTEQSGHTDALRGISGGSQESGKKVGLLQEAATSLIGFKAKRTQDVLERLTRLTLHCLTTRVPIQLITRIVSKYPPEAMPLIVARAKELEWDVDVHVEAAMAQAQMAKKQEAMTLFQMGAISMQTFCEKMNVDFQQEQERKANEAKAMMAAQPPQPGQPGAPPGNPPPSNGPPSNNSST